MANNTISQLEINGTTYDILDASARDAVSALNSAVYDGIIAVAGDSIESIDKPAAFIHTPGDLFPLLREGNSYDLCEAIRLISVGDALQYNTNYVITDVANVLSIKAPLSHDHSASDIIRGTLPVVYGGTGQDGTSYTDVAVNVVTAASGCTVTNANYAQWGKVAQVFLGIKCSSAKSFNDTLATIVSGKRPVMTTVLSSTDGTVAFGVTTGGLVQAKSSISAGTTLYVIGTYLLP